MTTRYTTRFRLNKPDFRTSPWSSQLNENADKIDEVIYKMMQANSIASFENNVVVELGTVLYDATTTTLWINNTEHTTVATGDFEDERFAHTEYWTQLQLGIEAKGQWQWDTFYPVNSLAYDASEGLAGLCSIEHTSPSSGTMRDDADNWIFLIDSGGGGGTPATSIAYDDTGQTITAENVQDAIDALDDDLTSVASDVSTLGSTVTSLSSSTAPKTAEYIVKSADSTLTAERALSDGTNITWDWTVAGAVKAVLAAGSVAASHITDATITFAKLATAAIATAAEILASTASKIVTADKLWDANAVYNLGNISGSVTLNFNTATNFRGVLTGNVTFQLPSNMKSGQSFSLFLTQDGTGGRTISFATGWYPLGGSTFTFNTTASTSNYICGQVTYTGSLIVYSGGKIS